MIFFSRKPTSAVTVKRQVKPLGEDYLKDHSTISDFIKLMNFFYVGLEVSGGCMIHIIRFENELFLSGIEMAALLPMCETEKDLERKMSQMGLYCVEYTVIYAQTTPNIFIECVT